MLDQDELVISENDVKAISDALEEGENNSIVTPWDIVMRTLKSDLGGIGDGTTTN